MRRISICNFETIEDLFNFGRYKGLSLADVLDINPSYLDWCVKHCTGIIFQLEDYALEEIKTVYPEFLMDSLFESKRIWNLNQYNEEDSDDETFYDSNFDNDIEQYDEDFDDMHTYERYSDSWAQSVEGNPDYEIETIFDSDSSAYWNID